MAGKPRKLHQLVPVFRNGKAYVFRTRWIYLGTWEGENPSAESVERLNRLKELWAVDPGAKANVASGLLLIELWRAWEASPECPTQASRDDFDRVERHLFGKKAVPGLHAFTLVADFSARNLRAWQSYLCVLKNDRGELRLGRDTIRRCIKMVRQCFAWGVVEGKIDQLHAASLLLVESPAKGKVKEEKKRASIDKAIADRAVLFLSPPLRSVVQLLWLTTARPSEILGLRVGSIQRSGSFLLRGGARLDLEGEGVWGAELVAHKTAEKGFERVLFFGPRAQAILAPYLNGSGYLFQPQAGRAYQLAEQARILTTTGGGNKKPKVETPTRQAGEFYSSDALQKAVKKACDRADIPQWSPYQIRHTASAAIQDSNGLEAASVYLGHRPRGVTGVYVGANLRLAAKVAREVG